MAVQTSINIGNLNTSDMVYEIPDVTSQTARQPSYQIKSPAQGNEVDPSKVQKVSDKLNTVLNDMDLETRITYDKDLGQYLVKVYNTRTNEVISEIPPEKLMNILNNVIKNAGLLVDERA